MKRSLITILFIISIVAVTSNAAVEKGDNEFNFAAAWLKADLASDFYDGDSVDLYTVSASVGHFFTDNIQVGVSGLGIWASLEDEDLNAYGLGVNAKYHFMTTKQYVPYVGVQGNILTAELDDDDADGTMWGPLAGLKMFITGSENVFVYAEYQHQLYEGDLGDAIDSVNLLFAGLGFKF
jgi:hypothetical protein